MPDKKLLKQRNEKLSERRAKKTKDKEIKGKRGREIKEAPEEEKKTAAKKTEMEAKKKNSKKGWMLQILNCFFLLVESQWRVKSNDQDEQEERWKIVLLSWTGMILCENNFNSLN